MKGNVIVGQSGGPTAAINASLAGVYRTAKDRGANKVYGMLHGIQGLLDEQYIDLSTQIHSELDIELLKRTPSAFLGSCRYKLPEDLSDPVYPELFQKFTEKEISYFFYIGGNDSMDTVDKLNTYAKAVGKDVKIVGIPKTIDNDIEGTEMSFGFQSAIDVATRTIDEIHTTAASHSRVFIVEIMGHKTGWLTLHSGIAGGADIILIPEIPYNVDEVLNTIRKREKQGKKFTIIAMAEGAISDEDAKLSKKELKEKRKTYTFPSVAYQLSDELQKKAGQEVRVTIPGHVQRGGIPSASDRILATRIGVEAAGLILRKDYGNIVCIKDGKFSKIPLEEVAGKTKMVNVDNELIRQAESLGISLGRKA